MKLDEIYVGILELLQEDARLSPREVARRLKEDFGIEISFSTVRRRIREMEEKKIIRGYTAILDPTYFKLNYPICFFLVTDPKVEVNKVAKELVSKIKELIYIHHVTGDFQIACLARCTDAEHAARISREIAQINGVQRIVSHSILCTFKEDIRLKLTD